MSAIEGSWCERPIGLTAGSMPGRMVRSRFDVRPTPNGQGLQELQGRSIDHLPTRSKLVSGFGRFALFGALDDDQEGAIELETNSAGGAI